jgi:ribosomal protein S18 acetylase RimI-like enzyme
LTQAAGMGDGVLLQAGSCSARCSIVEADSRAFGAAVGRVDDLRLDGPDGRQEVVTGIAEWLRDQSVAVASSRLDHVRLAETMALESIGFRFVEMILRPRRDLAGYEGTTSNELHTRIAQPSDLPALQEIAATAFDTGRYALDPRLPRGPSAARYAGWVSDALDHPRQRTWVGIDAGRLVGFFVVEREEEQIYWHLTAVAADVQGRGIGRRLWRAMLGRHRDEGIGSVSTRISAHNYRVLSLYSSLRFRFEAPEITLHWVVEGFGRGDGSVGAR